MYLNYRAISRVVAFFTVIFAIAMIPSAIIGLICREFDIALIFSVLIFVEALFGISILYMVRPSQVLLRTRDGFLLVALCWFLACFLGSLPFYFSEYITSFADAFFEATSGFTTTGASILTDIEALPKALLFWRTFTQWMGGFGIVFIPIAILPALGFEGHSLATAEHQGISLDKLSPKLSDSARHLFKLYVVLTVAETVLLLLGGLSPFDAITHSFSTMSTGGFSNYNGNIGHFQSNYIYLIIAIFMFLAGVNFNLYFLGIQKRFKALFKDLEFKYYCMIVFASIALISMSLACIEKLESGFDGIIHVVFQVVSIMSTTGFSTIDYDALWPNFIKITLIFLMIVGGCSSSPAGGMKMIRALMVFKMIKRATILKLHPNAIADMNFCPSAE